MSSSLPQSLGGTEWMMLALELLHKLYNGPSQDKRSTLTWRTKASFDQIGNCHQEAACLKATSITMLPKARWQPSLQSCTQLTINQSLTIWTTSRQTKGQEYRRLSTKSLRSSPRKRQWLPHMTRGLRNTGTSWPRRRTRRRPGKKRRRQG